MAKRLNLVHLRLKAILNKDSRRSIIFASGDKYIIEKISLRAKVTAFDKQSNECTIRFAENSLKIDVPASFRKLIVDAYSKYEEMEMDHP
jgi:hypothetical protein